jgi:YVTN family beta-propeller protein
LDRGSTSVSVIATATNTVVATIPMNTAPLGVVVSPDGQHVYVAKFYSNKVEVIATATNTKVATVPVGSGPAGVAIGP